MSNTVLGDIKVIDVDTHVVEPYDLWTSRVSDKFGDAVPHVVRGDNGADDVWVASGQVLGSAGGAAAAGWPENPPKHPPSLDAVHPEVYDSKARLGLMDRSGIHAQVLYPNVAGFGAGKFVEVADGELRLALLQAYNDFLSEFASAGSGRYIPVAAVPFWDLDLSIKEIARAKDNGHRGVIFSQAPEFFGQPMLTDPYWDKLWAACEEMSMPVNFHIGSGDVASGMTILHESRGAHANYSTIPVVFFLGIGKTIASLITSGICHRFPKLNFVAVESGVGWLPFLVEGLDWMWGECGVAKEHPEYDLLPSEYFKRQIKACFWFEHSESLQAAVNILGADSIMYETDFPHPTSMSPGPASKALAPKDFIEQKLAFLGKANLQKILHDNAAKVYGLA